MKNRMRRFTLLTLVAAMMLFTAGCAASNIHGTNSNASPNVPQIVTIPVNTETLPNVQTEQTEADVSTFPTEKESSSTLPPISTETEPALQTVKQETSAEDWQTKYIEILSGADAFFSTSYQRVMSIDEYLRAFASDTGIEPKVTKYTALDMDDDGVPELLLWLTINEYSDYGTILLRLQNEQIEEYTFAYRQMFDLKDDGSFALSGSESSSGYGKLQFDSAGWNYQEIPDNQQDAKNSAEWYEYPSENYSPILDVKK